MPSLLAWVDYSSAHREDMDRLLDAFRDKGTVDELGVGTVRNTFSELLFPGTSTLHTRARYLLFVPWAVTSVTARGLPLDRALRELRQQEVRLIEALRAGDIDGGVIGRDARANLERMASVAYWGALGTYKIKRCTHTIAQHCRHASERPMASLDEDDEGLQLRHVDPCFRQLPGAPRGWLATADFALTREEAEFLRDRIFDTCGDRYLAWLLQHGIDGDPDMPWDPVLTSGPPAGPARALSHARRFSLLHERRPDPLQPAAREAEGLAGRHRVLHGCLPGVVGRRGDPRCGVDVGAQGLLALPGTGRLAPELRHPDLRGCVGRARPGPNGPDS